MADDVGTGMTGPKLWKVSEGLENEFIYIYVAYIMGFL
jgi:hypothetical protein